MTFDASLLIGPPHQVAGSVWVVDSEYECDRLYERMMSSENEVWGLDLETRDINPKEESPAKGNGRIVVWSAAYFDEKLGTHPTTGYPLAQRIFVKNWGEAEDKRWLYKFQEWFEGPQYKKVGANFFGFDRHVFGNYGINVQGVYFDNVRASRLNDASAMEHGLKFQAIEYLGYVMRDYNELFKRAKLKKDGKPGKQMMLVPLLTVVQDPDWLNILIDYASLDAKISLELWPVMRDKLAQKEWRRDGTTMVDYYDKLQTPYYYVLNGAEREGWDLDEQWCSEQAEIATLDMDRLERELVAWTGVVMNFGSPKQLGHLLYATVPDTVVKANRNLIPGFGFAVPPVSKNKNRPKPWEEEDEDNPFRPTDAMALQYLADNVRAKKDKKGLRTLLEWRKIKDIKKYLVGLPLFQDSKGRVHCNTAPDTETARLSARKPALQQIPTPGKDPVADRYMIREAFTCPPGFMLIGADFSQLEMRILAHYLIVLFKDHKLADDLNAADLHSATALRVFGRKDIVLPESTSRYLDGIRVIESWSQIAKYVDDPEKSKFLNELPFIPYDTPVKMIKKFFFAFRNKGKIVNFSVNYGKTSYGLGNDLRDENGDPIGQDAAQLILDAYFDAYPAVLRFKKWSIGYATKRGFARSLLGRYRPLPLIWDQNRGIRGHEERKAQNTPIQMSAAEIAMMAQLKTNTIDMPELRDAGFFDEELARMGVVHLMQIHDELIFKVPHAHSVEACARVKMLMENPLDTPLTVPLPVDAKIAMNWASAK